MKKTIAIQITGMTYSSNLEEVIIKKWIVVPLISSYNVEGNDNGWFELYVTAGESTFYLIYRYKRDAEAAMNDIRLALEEYYD